MDNYSIKNILDEIQFCIENDVFAALETQNIELKDLSHPGEWNELYKTVCAFLNTNGGAVIIGIHEDKKNKKYKITGFNEHNESKLHSSLMKGENFIDEEGKKQTFNSETIYFELRPFMRKMIAIVFVNSVPDDEKYIYYKNGRAFERIMTGDRRVSEKDIKAHQEYKRQLVFARELTPITETNINNLSLRRINELVGEFNKNGFFGVNYFAKIEDAYPFLENNYFVHKGDVTLLGLLVCGENPAYYLDKKCEVNGFLETPNKIAEDKGIFRANIIELMTSTLRFVWKNIRVGRMVTNGGQADPEYTEDLIREVINNALAHRDYKANRPIQVFIHPHERLEVKNPGSFFQRMLITINEKETHTFVRRIKPPKGTPESKNPKLANLLKKLEKLENKGRGMLTLVNEALKNKIDLPYYSIADETIILNVPSGKLLDEKVELLLQAYNKFIWEKLDREDLTQSQKIVLAYFYKAMLEDENEHYTILLTKDNNHLKEIKSLEKSGLIYKHLQSPEYYPIYRIHPQLMRTNYKKELREIFGSGFDEIRSIYKNILNTTYIHNQFNKNKRVSANIIANYLFYNQNKRVTDVRIYEGFRSKVRRGFQVLSNNGYLTKDESLPQNKPRYMLNFHYRKGTRLLFD